MKTILLSMGVIDTTEIDIVSTQPAVCKIRKTGTEFDEEVIEIASYRYELTSENIKSIKDNIDKLLEMIEQYERTDD